ncbi:MAG: pilus assembly protein PilM [Verrucomicrobia bacterium]|nr:pilus assembly protein PilM [Verrucomicrobiota bacterium]
MDFPFFNGRTKKRDQFVAIDLGSKSTKAVYLQRKPDGVNLLGYVIQEAPIFEKAPSPELLAEHFKSLHRALGAKTKNLVIALSVNDSLLRQAELPMIASADMRTILKLNSKTYLQRDLGDHSFDCHTLPAATGALAATAKSGEAAKGGVKTRVLIGGAKTQYLEDLQTAAKMSGLIAEEITPGPVGPVNAFEMNFPDAFQKDVIALVDIGYKNSSISIIHAGELVLNRVVSQGGDKLTAGLAESMGISYGEAESIKVGLPDEVKSNLQMLVSPLGRELRTSIDFFENQHDKPVSEVYVSGASAKSAFILEILQEELMLPCKSWNPTGSLKLQLAPETLSNLELVAPELTVAIGAASGALN